MLDSVHSVTSDTALKWRSNCTSSSSIVVKRKESSVVRDRVRWRMTRRIVGTIDFNLVRWVLVTNGAMARIVVK